MTAIAPAAPTETPTEAPPEPPRERIALKFAGTVYLDRSDPADVALFRSLEIGTEVALTVEGTVQQTLKKRDGTKEGGFLIIERQVKLQAAYGANVH